MDIFPGKLYHFRLKSGTAVYVDDMWELKKSVDKLKKLNIKMGYPGYGKPFSPDKIFGTAASISLLCCP